MKKIIFSLAIFAVSCTPSLFAATSTWTGASNGNWDDGGNWSGGVPSSTDTALFNNATNTTISLNGANRSVANITFDTSVGNFTFNGGANTLQLANNGLILLNNTATGTGLTETFNTNISLGGNYTFSNKRSDISSTLIFNGPITNSATSTLSVNNGSLTGAGAIVLAGVISDGTGVQSISKSGDNVVFLLGANTFSGSAGFLAAAGNGGTIVFNSIANAGTTANSFGTGSGAITTSYSAGNSLSTLRYIGSGGSTNRVLETGNSAVITGANSFVTLDASGSGALTWGGFSASNFGSEANNRTLRLDGTSQAANTFSAAITNPGGGGAATTIFQKNGTGNWVLNAANSFTGGITVNNGKLTLDYATNGTVVSATNALTLGGANLEIKGKTGAFSTTQTLGNLTLTTLTGNTITVNSNGGTSSTLTLGNTWTRGAQSSLLIDLSSGNATLTSSPTLSAGLGVLGYAMVKDATGVGLATVSGGNVVRLTTFTTMTAGFTSSNSANFALANSGTLTLTGASRNIGSLSIDTSNNGALDLNALTLTMADGTYKPLAFTGTGNYNITGGTLAYGNNNIEIHQYSTGVATISAALGSGTATITKDGPGTLVVGNKAGSGSLRINGGALRADNSNVLTGATSVSNGGVLELTSNSGNWTGALGTAAGNINFVGDGGFSAFGTNRTVNIGGSGASITWGATNFVGNNNALVLSGKDSNALIDFQNGLNFGSQQRVVNVNNGSATVDGRLSGVLTSNYGGGLIKQGVGTLEITGNSNTYAGDTWVSAGTLLVNNTSGSATGTGNVLVQSGGTLGGSGTISGGVTVASGGILAPGNSPGLLAVGSLTLNSGSATAFEINGTVRGTSYDAIDISSGGALTLGGAFTIAFGTSLLDNTTLDLFSFNAGSTGDFSSLVSTGSYAGTWGKTGEVWSLSSGGQVLNFSEITGDLTVVPEPATWILLTGSLTVVMVMRRRRQS